MIRTVVLFVVLVCFTAVGQAQDNKHVIDRQGYTDLFHHVLWDDQQMTNEHIATLSFADYRSLVNRKIDTLRTALKKVKDAQFVKEEQEFLDRFLPMTLFRYARAKKERGMIADDQDFVVFAEGIDYADERNASLLGYYAEWKYACEKPSLPLQAYIMHLMAERDKNHLSLDKRLEEVMRTAFGYAQTEELPAIWKTFNRLVADTTKVAALRPFYEKSTRLQKGKKLADALVKDPDGKECKLSDVLSKEKMTLIDMWATWCAPCVYETPFLKELEKTIHEKVQVISLSMDTNVEKWKKQVSEEALPWPQYLLPGNFKSEFAKYYGLESIPRFILVDRQGCIANGNMPRPSSGNIFMDAIEKEGTLHISGDLTDLGNDTLTICNFIRGGQEYQTKVKGHDGHFEARIPIDGVQSLLLAEIRTKNGEQTFDFQFLVAVPGEEVYVSGSMDSIHCTGGYFYQQLDRVLGMSEIRDYKTYRDSVTQLIRNNPDNEAFSTLMDQLKDDDLIAAYNLLSPELKEGRMANFYKPLIEAVETKKALQQSADKLQSGSPAQDISLPSLDGKQIRLSSLRGKYVILDFWGSWCHWCIKGIPKMKEYYAKYRQKLEILGIDCNDTDKKWREAVEKHDIPWLHVRQAENSSAAVNAYGVQSFPTKVIINPDGTINKVFRGESDSFYDYLDAIFGTAK